MSNIASAYRIVRPLIAFIGALLLPACADPHGHEAPAPKAAPRTHSAIARTSRGASPASADDVGRLNSALNSPNDVAWHGGSVISDVSVVGVYWGSGLDSTIYSTMPGFYQAVVDNPYLDWLAEYNTPSQGICRGSLHGMFSITPTNTNTHLFDSEIQSELAQQIDAGHVDNDGLGGTDPNRLYMIHFPRNVSITASDGTRSCVDFCAYHDSFLHNGHRIRYAVLPDVGAGACDGGCGGGSSIQNQMSAASHEMLEAITDPDPFSGWYGPHSEIGDTCNQQEDTLPGTGYTVQRMWSTAQTACVTTRAVPVSSARIDRLDPASAPYKSSPFINIFGSCFSHPVVTVNKNGHTASATVESWQSSPTWIEVQMPSSPDGTPGDAQLNIANGGANGPGTSTFNYFYVGPSNVSISPATGGMQGGTAVTITGQGFVLWPDVTSVTFGGVPSSSVRCSSTTSCIAYAPPHDPGVVQVVVTASGSAATSANNFTYVGPQITQVTPNQGPISGGTHVYVHGVNMADTSQTTFSAAATLGGLVLGNIPCLREGSTDASCDFITPAIGSPPLDPLDIRITVTHTTGTQVQTELSSLDKFTYRFLPTPASLSFSGGAVGGATITGTVTLDGNGVAGGSVVSLALAPGAPAGVVSLPSTVMVAANQLSATFPVTIIAQSFSGAVPIVASYGGGSVTGVLNVWPTPAPQLAAINQLCSTQTYVETITLAEPAPPGGGAVALTSSSPLATVPATVTVPAGAMTATFPITTGSTTTAQTVTIGASYFGIAAEPVSAQVLPAAAVALDLSPTSVDGGKSATGTVTVCTPAPPGSSIALSSSSSVAGVPASVPISGTSASFTVSTSIPRNTTTATITATYQSTSVQKSLTVVAPLRCTPPKKLCTCGDGTQACLSTADQCLAFCGG